jgi:hypothetical protein
VAGKAMNKFVLVLEYTTGQVACDSHVQHVEPLVVRHYVDVEVFWLWHRDLPLRARSFTRLTPGSG